MRLKLICHFLKFSSFFLFLLSSFSSFSKKNSHQYFSNWGRPLVEWRRFMIITRCSFFLRFFFSSSVDSRQFLIAFVGFVSSSSIHSGTTWVELSLAGSRGTLCYPVIKTPSSLGKIGMNPKFEYLQFYFMVCTRGSAPSCLRSPTPYVPHWYEY